MTDDRYNPTHPRHRELMLPCCAQGLHAPAAPEPRKIYAVVESQDGTPELVSSTIIRETALYFFTDTTAATQWSRRVGKATGPCLTAADALARYRTQLLARLAKAELVVDRCRKNLDWSPSTACPTCQHGAYPMVGGGSCPTCGRPITGTLDQQS